MLQGKISNYVLLIGMILIIWNTIFMILNLVVELVVLIFTLLWAFVKIAYYCLSNYPLTILALIIINYFKRNKSYYRTKSFLYSLVIKVFS